MTDDQLWELLVAANPLPRDDAANLAISAGETELLTALLAEHSQPTRVPRRILRCPSRTVPRVGLAVAAAAIVLLALLSLGRGSGERDSGTAWAAEQLRFAEASPLVLLSAPGWRVEYADEESAQEGELHFRLRSTPPPVRRTASPAATAAPVPADTGSAQLHWRGGALSGWTQDRAAGAAVATTAPVLGTTARVYQYVGGTPGHRDITALFAYDGRVLEFRAGAANIRAFKRLLATLKQVDTDAWLTAMPGSAIRPGNHNETIARMLRGVAVPPGFDPDAIKGATLTKDRYQLGAAVTGAVACQWFSRWANARRAGDDARVREAIAAMATAKDWPILKEMTKHGHYPEVLLDFAAAMPSGRWHGRPLAGDADSGLGCHVLGITLPGSAHRP